MMKLVSLASEEDAAHFSPCPACSSEGTVQFFGGLKTSLVCSSCKARWAPVATAGDEKPVLWALTKRGKNKAAKPLLKKAKAVPFWRGVKVETFDPSMERKVRALFLAEAKARGKNPSAAADAFRQIEGFGAPGLLEVKNLAGDPSHGCRFSALRYLALHGDDQWKRTVPLILESDDEKRRCAAIDWACILMADTGDDSLVPNVTDALANDESPTVRSAAAIALQLVEPSPQVIDALAQALHDDARPPEDPILASSLTGFLLAAAKSAPKATVAAQAKNTLSRSDDPQAKAALRSHDAGG